MLPQTVVQVPVAAPVPGQVTPPQVAATTGNSTNTSTVQPAAGVMPALDDAVAQAKAQAEGVAAVAKAKADQRAAEAAGAGMRSEEATREANEMAEAQRRGLERLNKVISLADADEQKYSNFKFKDYWDSQPVGAHIVASLGALFGGFGASENGGRNLALEQINHRADQFFEQQKAELMAQENRVKMRRSGVADTMAALDKELAGITLKQAKAKEAIAEKAVQMQLEKGVPLEQAMAAPEVHAILAAADKDRAAALQHYDTHVTKEAQRSTTITSATGQGSQPTSEQNKTADLSAAMLKELETIKGLPALSQKALAHVQNNELASNQADKATGLLGVVGAKVGRAMGLVPRTKYQGLGPSEQKSMNAWDALVELRARQLTGAGMPAEEATREARTLGYSPGDSPEVMQQKIQRLEDSAKRGMALSGAAGIAATTGRPVTVTKGGGVVPMAGGEQKMTRAEAGKLMDAAGKLPAGNPKKQQILDILKANGYGR